MLYVLEYIPVYSYVYNSVHILVPSTSLYPQEYVEQPCALMCRAFSLIQTQPSA